MERSPTPLLVVAAAILDGNGRLLLQQALPRKRHAGHWEFPGGKVEATESPRFALGREIREELALELDLEALEPAGFAEERPGKGGAGIVLLLYSCSRWSGEPEALEGQRWGWFSPAEAAALPMAELDLSLLRGLHGDMAS